MATKNSKVWWLTAIFVCALFLTGTFHSVSGEQKLKYGTAIRLNPGFSMPVLAAEEKGFWKAQGLNVEWVTFKGGAPFFSAMAAGHIKVGGVTAPGALQAAARGVSLVMVYELWCCDPFVIWVKSDSRLKRPQDLKRAKLGIIRYGSISHAYVQAVLKALGIEDQVKLSSMGGVRPGMAGLKAGIIDAWLHSQRLGWTMGFAGQVRPLVSIGDYLPQPWIAYVVAAHRDLTRTNPELVRRLLKAISQSIDFILTNPDWAIPKIKAELRMTESGAQEQYRAFNLSRGGIIKRKAIENVANFLIEYGLISKEKAPPVDELYSNAFLPAR